MSNQDRAPALGGTAHPADNIPARKTAAQRAAERAAERAAQEERDQAEAEGRQLSAVPDPEHESDTSAQEEAVDAEQEVVEAEQEPVETEEARAAKQPKNRRAPSKSAARPKAVVTQDRPALSRLQSKQMKKSLSDAAFSTASSMRRAQERLDDLGETIQRCVAEGLPPFVIEGELHAAAAAAEIELPMDELRNLIYHS